MANTIRFSLKNLLASATLKNGTGGGAPGRSEVTPWVMENAQTQDRTLLWQNGATVNYDLDLGADTSQRLYATLAARSSPVSLAGITGVEIFTATAAGGYPAGLASRGTYAMAAGQRDGYLLLGGNASYRYVRFAITTATAFTLGRVFAGLLDVDLGMKYSPSAKRTLIRPTQRNVPGTGSPLLTRVGDDFFQYSFPYDNIDETTLGKLQQVASANDILMIDRDDTIKQCVLQNDTWSYAHLYDSPDQHSSSLELVQLG